MIPPVLPVPPRFAWAAASKRLMGASPSAEGSAAAGVVPVAGAVGVSAVAGARGASRGADCCCSCWTFSGIPL